MVFSKEQWAKMRYDISELQPNEKVTDRFPEINSIFKNVGKWMQSHDITDEETFLRYLILVYHKHSPFAKNVADVIDRKVSVLEYLNVKRNKDGRFSDKIDDLIFVRNENTAYLTIHFIKYENDRLWAKYCVNSELYWRAMFLTMKEGETPGNKGADEILKIQLENKKKLNDIEKEMEAQENLIFSDDRDVANYVPSYLEEEKKMKIFPEDYFLKDE